MEIVSLFVPIFAWVAVTYWVTVRFVYRVWVDPPFQGWGAARQQQQQRKQQALREVGLSQAEYEEARRLAADKRSVVEVALAHGGDVLREIAGIDDVVNSCIRDFSLGACARDIALVIPWTKVLKIGKIVEKTIDAVRATISWVRRRDRAQKSLRAVEAAQERIKRAERSCAANSFVPGTLVLMADGSRKPIEQVELGDKVLATDPETGVTVSRRVVATITGTGAKQLVDLTVRSAGDRGDSARGTITATAGHPFWRVRTGGIITGSRAVSGKVWVEAENLTVGDVLRQADGRDAVVVDTQERRARRTVHNLTINLDHTYHVALVGTLVHNAGACGDDPAQKLTTSQQRALRSLEKRRDEHVDKLNAYRANPDGYDNQGILARAPTPEVRQRVIDGRIRHLEQEIDNFQSQIDKIRGGS